MKRVRFATGRVLVRAGLAIPAILAVGACARGGAVPDGVPDPGRVTPDAWTVAIAPHADLWYHGLAYAWASVPNAQDHVLPLFRPDYVPQIVSVKRSLGLFPTVLDERAAEFGTIFVDGGSYVPLQFLPLYFEDADALFSGIRLWREVEGNPRRAGSGEAARVVAFLSSLFPDDDERRVVAEWAEVLRRERDVFYVQYHDMRRARLDERAAAVQDEWDELAPELNAFLDYMQIEGGRLLLVPALDGEGRSVMGGRVRPTVAVALPAAGAADDAVAAFVHELTYPLVDDVVRDYVAPVRIREIGRRRLLARAAVRAGAILLERVAPARVPGYRRFFLSRANPVEPVDDGNAARADEAAESAFFRAFPLPEGLADGLRQAIERAQGGI